MVHGPRAMPGTDEFTEAMWKRELDAARKNPSKRSKAAGKKKVDATKIAPSQGKDGLRRLSTVEVASAKQLKQSKQTVAYSVAASTTTRLPTAALSSKVVAGASGSKGAASVTKMQCPSISITFLLLEPWRQHLWTNLKSRHHMIEQLRIQQPKLHQG
jgi:hypothetical protein